MIKFGKDLTQCIFIKTTLHHFTLFKTKGYAKGFSVIKRHRKSRKSIPGWRQYFMYPIRENANERLCVWLWEIWGISFHRFSTRPSMCWNYRHPEERKERVFSGRWAPEMKALRLFRSRTSSPRGMRSGAHLLWRVRVMKSVLMCFFGKKFLLSQEIYCHTSVSCSHACFLVSNLK